MVYFAEDGAMDKPTFLATWKDIASENERQFTVTTMMPGDADTISNQLHACNIFRVSYNAVDGQSALYHSIKLINGIWLLAELKVSPGALQHTLALKCRAAEACTMVAEAVNQILSVAGGSSGGAGSPVGL